MGGIVYHPDISNLNYLYQRGVIMSNVQIGSGSGGDINGGSNSGGGVPIFKIILYIGIIVLICKSIGIF